MATIRQTSFAAGELSPYLYGRQDLELYAHGGRTLFNFFVNKQGAAVSRPGTEYTATCRSNDVKLIPFVVTDSESYILEFGEGYVRVHRRGYLGIELATPYRAADLPELQWAQTGSILLLTHPSYPAKELRGPSNIVGSSFVFVNAAYVSAVDDASFDPIAIAPWFKRRDGSLAARPLLVDNPAGTLFVTDAAHPPREWRWKVSTLLRHRVSGRLAETYAVDITQYYNGTNPATLTTMPADSMVVLFPDRGVSIRTPDFGVAAPAPFNWDFVGLAFYRGRGQLYGLVGTTDNNQDFADLGEAPNYLVPPLVADSSPFVTGEYPAACAFFQQRRVLAGTNSRVSTVWASAVDNYENHKAPILPYEGQPLEWTRAARRRERIRSMVAHRRLLVFTDSSVWSDGGADGGLDFANVDTRVEDEVGSESIPPVVVDGSVLFVRSKGHGVRALSLTDGGQYAAADISWHSQHLFVGQDPTAQRASGYSYRPPSELSRRIVSWATQEDPHGVVWAVRADGVLLSLTKTGPNGWAWCRHETPTNRVPVSRSQRFLLDLTSLPDRFISVAVVPETEEDGVYFAVRRDNSTYIERLCSRITTNTADDYACVDSAVRYEGAPTATFTGLSHLDNRYVYVTAKGSHPIGPLRVSGGSVTVPTALAANFQASGDQGEETLVAYIGLAFVADLETLDAAQAKLNQKNVVKVGFEVDTAQGLYVGEDFDNLVPWRQRGTVDDYEFPSAASALVVVNVKGAWQRTGRAVLRQTLPLPVMVLGITRELDVGGS